jgi:hypothetical protein
MPRALTSQLTSQLGLSSLLWRDRARRAAAHRRDRAGTDQASSRGCCIRGGGALIFATTQENCRADYRAEKKGLFHLFLLIPRLAAGRNARFHLPRSADLLKRKP